MSDTNTVHASFTVRRRYAAAPARVFQAFADPDIKARWFKAPGGWVTVGRSHDFRVGGRETARSGPPGDPTHGFDAAYHNIVENERIIYSYAMDIAGKPISVSLATVEFKPDGTGTLLSITEHGAFLDGYDDAGSREHGTKEVLMEQLAAVVDA